MRTTIDLPDELFRRAKATAAMQGIKLKDLIASFIENGLEQPSPLLVRESRGPLPWVRESTGNPIPALTNAELDAILLEEDLSGPL